MDLSKRALKPLVDPARMVKIKFTLKYVECDLADKRVESEPIAQLFFSNHFDRSPETGGVLNLRLDEDDLDRTYEGTLIASLSREHDYMSPTACIGIGSYAMHRNDFGAACDVNVGTTHAFLDEMLTEVKTKGYYDHTHDLLMRTVVITGSPPLKKGVIELRVDSIETGPGLRLPPSRMQSPLRAPITSIEDSLVTYIQGTMEIEAQLPDLLPNTERIRAPMDISQVGIEMTGQAFLPIAAFAIIETPESNADYFRNAFERVMARKNMTVSNYYDFDEKEKSRTMAAIICYGVQSFDYIGDSVELNNRNAKKTGSSTRVEAAMSGRRHAGTEEFSDIWNSLAGDCEDGARGIMTSLKAFRTVEFDPSRDKHLIEMQQIARDDYVPLMSLAVVHGQKIGDQEGFGAHMYLPLMPKHQFVRGLSKTAAGRQFLQRIRPSLSEKTLSYTAEERPLLVCEGTGRIDPIGYPVDHLYEKRKIVATRMPSTAGAKKEIPRIEHEGSPFYYATLLGISEEYIEDVGVGGFVLGTVNPNYNPMDPANGHEMLRGHLFTDTIQGNDNLAIIPQPIIPESTMAVIKEAISLRPPPRAHVLDHSKPKVGKTKEPELDRLVSTVKGFKRRAPVGARGSGPVDMTMRPHMFDANLVSRMINDAQRVEEVFDAEYEVEHITNSIYGYRVMWYLK